MTQNDILGLCRLFKGEQDSPYKNASHNAQIWCAERFCYEHSDIINSEEEFVDYIESFIGKWNPWDFGSIMDTYNKLSNGQ